MKFEFICFEIVIPKHGLFAKNYCTFDAAFVLLLYKACPYLCTYNTDKNVDKRLPNHPSEMGYMRKLEGSEFVQYK